MTPRAAPGQPLLITTFFVIMIGLGLLSATSWYADKRLADATGMVTHTLEVLTTLELIKSNMAQAESAQRGYFLQRKPSFLNERERALDAVREGIITIHRLTLDNPAQGLRIIALRDLFRTHSATFIETQQRKQANQLSSQEAYFSGGARIWIQLEEYTDEIRRIETDLLATRISSKTSSSHLARYSFALFLLVLLTALCLLMTQAYRDIGRKRRASEALQDAKSELIRRQQAREVAEAADRSKSQFLANMSHEIRSPLSAILGLGYLLEQARLEPEARNMVRLMMVSGRTLLCSINDILDVSKIASGHMVLEQIPFRLADVIDKIAVSMRLAVADKPIDLVIHRPPADVKTVMGDALRLEQVLLNLTSNAIKFTATGRITLRTEVVARRGDQVTLRFCVCDTGIGVAPAMQDAIFSAFTQADSSTTRRFGGTGLGLTICRQLVALMGGKIGLTSTFGAGSEFWFTLPLQQCDDVIAESAAGIDSNTAGDAGSVIKSGSDINSASVFAGNVADKMKLDGVRLLVVDDSEINRAVAQRILASEGALVTLAENGQDAIEWLVANPGDVDLVLMDVQMPVMDGIEATRQLRRHPQFDDLPIVALTAGAFKSHHDEALAAGMTHFISKPFDVPATIALVQRLRRGRSASMAATVLPSAPVSAPVAAPVAAPVSMPVSVPVSVPAATLLPMTTTMDVTRGLQLWSDIRTYRIYLQRFASGYAGVIGQLESQLSTSDRRSAAALAHKLSGDAANLGLPDLHQLAGQLERFLSSDQDVASLLVQLRAAMVLAQQAIADFAPAVATLPVDPDQRVDALTPAGRIDVLALLDALLEALDKDDPAPAEPLLAALALQLPPTALAPVRTCLHDFDFRAAEASVRHLALHYALPLKD